MTAPQVTGFDKISPTALLVAYARQFSDIPYATELAQLVNAQVVFDQYANNGQKKLFHLGPIVEARFKAVNYVLAKFEGTQVIELASGLLPRGMVMSQNPNIIFVESDLPSMASFKKQIVTQLIGERSNLYFEAIDVTKKPNQLPLHADYLRSDQKVIILCEGLLHYLTFPEKEQVFANIREMLRCYGGVWITPDLTTKKRALRMQGYNKAAQKLFQAISKTTDRSLIENSFNDIEHVKRFVLEQGFSIKEYSQLEVMDELISLKQWAVVPDSIKSILAETPVFALTLIEAENDPIQATSLSSDLSDCVVLN